jgi:hypothetical protein
VKGHSLPENFLDDPENIIRKHPANPPSETATPSSLELSRRAAEADGPFEELSSSTTSSEEPPIQSIDHSKCNLTRVDCEQNSQEFQKVLRDNPTVNERAAAQPLVLPLEEKDFPVLGKLNIERIEKFNGDADRLDEFITEVDGFIFANDVPVNHGSYVQKKGGGHLGFDYVATDQAAVLGNQVMSNYEYSAKFCATISERFTDNAKR